VVVLVLLFLLCVVGPTRWPDDAIFVPRDAATIREAFDRAAPGATIVLQARVEPYVGPVMIDTPNVTFAAARGVVMLASDGADPALTVRADGVTVRAVAIVSGSVGLRIESARCSIQDVRIDDAAVGVQLVGAQECDLRSVEVTGGRTGIELVTSGGNHLTDISVRGAAESGVKVLGSSGNTLEGVDIFDVPIGISLERGSSENEIRGCRIERASLVGVEFRGASDNAVARCAVRDAAIGITLEGVTGNRIEDCEIEAIDVAGIALQQAVQNRVMGNRIGGSGEAGLRLSQSAENALSYNRVVDCTDAGIRLDASDRNLVIGNWLEANGVGIDANRSSDGRILRNVVSHSDRIGILFVGGSENRLFDNHISGGDWGILLSESTGNTLLRNRVEEQKAVGLSLTNGSQVTRAAENVLIDSLAGILIVNSARSDVLNNVVRQNDTGLLLVRPGSGVRIEGNAIEFNRIGLRQADEPDVPGIGDLLDGGGDVAAPILASNRFARNAAFDVSNETSSPIYVAGNWWGDASGTADLGAAHVSSGVDLEGSAWKGTVAIGTEAGISQEILGRILQQVLTAAGFRVIDLIGMGSGDRLRDALRAKDVDFVWWGTSETIFPDGADDASRVVLTPIPASSHWVAVIPETTAQRLEEPTLTAYAALLLEADEDFRYTATTAFDRDASSEFEDAYGLAGAVGSVSRAATLGEAETLLKFGAVDMAIVGNLEETLTSSGFIALEDDLGVFEPVELLVASRSESLARFQEIEGLLANVAGSLTTAAIHDLVSRVRLLQQQAETVTRDYLIQQGHLEE